MTIPKKDLLTKYGSPTLIEKLNSIHETVNVKDLINLHFYLKSIGEGFWFWKRVKENKGMDFLPIVDDSKIKNMAPALLEAFKNPTTENSLIAIIRAIFGDCVIFFDYVDPKVINITIEVSSGSQIFLSEWISLDGFNIVYQVNSVIEDEIVFKGANQPLISDLNEFIKLFVAAGCKIQIIIEVLFPKNLTIGGKNLTIGGKNLTIKYI